MTADECYVVICSWCKLPVYGLVVQDLDPAWPIMTPFMVVCNCEVDDQARRRGERQLTEQIEFMEKNNVDLEAWREIIRSLRFDLYSRAKWPNVHIERLRPDDDGAEAGQ